MSWFHDLTGFHETTWEDTRSKLEATDGRLKSRVNGRSWAIGTLETPSLADLRARARRYPPVPGARPRVRNLCADARALHAQSSSKGALIQVASQFNLLEMIGPDVTPEQGVTIYQNDPTQGPACAIAAGAGTMYRNYFADTGHGLGQTRDRQVDTLRDLARAVAPGGIPMRNGYALPESDTLHQIATKLRGCDASELDRLRRLLRIGLHRDVEVTEPGAGQGQLVTQAFCSALPVAYSRVEARHWEPFARLVLEAAYEATLWAAVENAARGGSKTVFLTMLGGGAFGNDKAWILDAIRRALDAMRGQDLDVCIVSYQQVSAELERLADDYAGHKAKAGAPVTSGGPAKVERTDLRDMRLFDVDGDVDPRAHPNCYWLARGHILAGEYPRTPVAESSRARLTALLDANVRRFVDLTESREPLEPYEAMLSELAASRGIDVLYIRHAIKDLGVPSAALMREIVDAVLSPHVGVTYVHCWGGIGRTGTVAGCVLVEAGYSAQEAIDLVARKWKAVGKYRRRPRSPETEAQFEFIRNWKPRTNNDRQEEP